VNGLGNLIIGYNELRGSGDDRTGSHNLVLGSRNNHSSYAGIVGGQETGIATPFSTAIEGQTFNLRATEAFTLRSETLVLNADRTAVLRSSDRLAVESTGDLRLRADGSANLSAAGNLVLRGATVQIN
jgi:hypothetical protein